MSGFDPAFGAGFAFDAEGLSEACERLGPGHASPSGNANAPLPGTLPETGMGERAALGALSSVILDGSRDLGAPGAFAHMDPPTPWVTWVAALWSASVNQNLLHADTAPRGRELEACLIGWLAPFFGMRGGQLVPGSTLANLTSLWAACELRRVEEVVASAAAHVSVRKSARILGLRYREVPVDPAQRLLAAQLGDLSRAALVLTAGTTATGAVDPLEAGTSAAWRHVDAAWAGPLRLSRRHAALLDGIEAADSVAVSAHKWLFQPKESALVLFARPDEAFDALSFGGDYLAAPNVGLLGSHGMGAAAALAATLLAWGRAGTAQRIEHCMELARELAERIGAEPELELYAPPVTGVLAWRHRRVAAPLLRARLRDAFVSQTTLEGEPWLRSVAANPNAESARVVAAVMRAAREDAPCATLA